EAEAAPGGLAWEKPPCGEGADGGTPCRWAALPYGEPWRTSGGPTRRGTLLIREGGGAGRTYFLSEPPEGTRMSELAAVAGGVGALRACLREARRDADLEGYEVRSWDGWYRHVTLSMLAHAALTAARAQDASA
ncbi:IS701 family transposase, partial [Alienimonas sp. DA493]